jgi:hypothetical protein
MISFAGTRLSEQPIHNNGGVCPLAKSAKKFGSIANACSTHFYYFLFFYKKSHFLLLFKLISQSQTLNRCKEHFCLNYTVLLSFNYSLKLI